MCLLRDPDRARVLDAQEARCSPPRPSAARQRVQPAPPRPQGCNHALPACQTIKPKLVTGCGRGPFTVPGCLLSTFCLRFTARERACRARRAVRRVTQWLGAYQVYVQHGSNLVLQSSWLPAPHAVSMNERQQCIMLACQALCAAYVPRTERLPASQRPAVPTCMLSVPRAWLLVVG